MRSACLTLCIIVALTACGRSGQDGQGASHPSSSTASSSDTADTSIPASIDDGVALTEAATEIEHAEVEDAAVEHAIAEEIVAAEEAAADEGDAASHSEDAESEAAREWRMATALRLTLLVIDRRTGKGVEGARFAYGKTDAEGRADTRRSMPDEGEQIEVHCPGRTYRLGPLLGSAPFRIANGHADAVFEVDSSRCNEPPTRTWRQRFAGTYRFEFEMSSFIPCDGMPAESAYYKPPGSFWVHLESPQVWEAISKVTGPETSRHAENIVYVEWLATATGPGAYGHMGASLYEMKVETLYKVSATAPASCRNATQAREMFLPPPPPPPPPRPTEAEAPML